MNRISNAVFAFVIASGTAGAAQAAGVDQASLEECKSQVSEYYGGASDVTYVGKRQYRDGLEMKLAVRSEDATTGYTTTRLAKCWLGADNYQAYSHNERTEAMLADANGETPAVLDVTIP